MSFFGNPPNNGPSALDVAKIEMEVTTDMFNKLATTCFKKCVGGYHDAELQVGEMACVDRCVSKYMQAQKVVEQTLQKHEELLRKQEELGLKMNPQGNKFGPGTR